MITKGINYSDNLFVTGQSQQSFAHREAAFYFEGDVYLRQVNTQGNSIFFTAAIDASRYEISGAGNNIFSDTAGMNQPFFISWNSGKIERIWLHHTTSAATAAAIRTLMSYLQYQQQPYGTNIAETVEDDPNGHCTILYKFYHMLNGSDSAVKEKKYYLQKKGEYDFNELKTTYTPEGAVSIVIQKQNIFPLLVDGTEKITTRLSQKIIGQSETIIRIQNKETTTNQLTTEQLTKKMDTGSNYSPVSIYVYTSSREFRKNIRKDILGTDSLQALVEKLHSTFAEDETDSMVLKLKSLATVHPTTAYPLAAILDTTTSKSRIYKIITAALFDAETDNSINALSQLAWKHREDWEYAKGLITNTGLNAQVTDSAVAFFKSIALFNPMSKTSRAAWMALGTMTDNIYKQDATAGEALWKWICDSLQTLDTYNGAIRIKLLVWGNSNQPAAFDSVTKFIKSTNEELRSVAVVCTGQFSFAGKIPFLLDVVRNDTVMSIRSNAARALSGQLSESMPLNYIREMLQSENDSSIRESLLSTIDIKSSEKKLIQEILQEAERKDSSLTVRRAATDMLRRMDD
ncbi:MAG: HEAT repeat domain-containing protein [Ferruginibacter sp.]